MTSADILRDPILRRAHLLSDALERIEDPQAALRFAIDCEDFVADGTGTQAIHGFLGGLEEFVDGAIADDSQPQKLEPPKPPTLEEVEADKPAACKETPWSGVKQVLDEEVAASQEAVKTKDSRTVGDRIVAAVEALGPDCSNREIADAAGTTTSSVGGFLPKLIREKRLYQVGRFNTRQLFPYDKRPQESAPEAVPEHVTEQHETRPDKILNALRKLGPHASNRQIAEETGPKKHQVDSALTYMEHEGQIVRQRYGPGSRKIYPADNQEIPLDMEPDAPPEGSSKVTCERCATVFYSTESDLTKCLVCRNR